MDELFACDNAKQVFELGQETRYISLDVGELLTKLVQGETVKLEVEVAVTPFTVTLMVPEVTPDGTVTVKEKLELELTVAVNPLNLTVLLEAVEEKLLPEIVTEVPAKPNVGEKLLIETEPLVELDDPLDPLLEEDEEDLEPPPATKSMSALELLSVLFPEGQLMRGRIQKANRERYVILFICKILSILIFHLK